MSVVGAILLAGRSSGRAGPPGAPAARRLNGAGLLPLVRAGVKFVDGRPEARGETETEAQKEAA